LQADLVLQTPEPSALLIEITPQGMRFQLNFWIEDATKGQMLARSQVNIAALHALRQANVMLSSAAQEVVVHQASVNSLS
jgi:small-conductance mechanosensitive channel